MAITRNGHGAAAFSASSTTVVLPAPAGQCTQIVAITYKPSGAGVNVVLPSGWLSNGTVQNTVGATAICYRFGTFANNQSQTFNFVNASNSPVTVDGVIGFHVSESQIGTSASQSSASFTSTHTAPAVFVSEDGSMLLSIIGTNQYPRLHSTAGVTELQDVSNGNGPSLCFGDKQVATSTTEAAVNWTSVDFYGDSPANDTEAYQGVSIALIPIPAASGDPTLTGGGTIPVAEIESVAWSDLLDLAIGTPEAGTLTVTGDDGAPIQGLSVDFAVSGGGTISPTSTTTNASGVASFTLTPQFAGTWLISASIAGSAYQKSFEVDGSSVSITAPSATTVGQTIVIQVTATNASGAPLVGAQVAMFSRGQVIAVVDAGSGVTDGAGVYRWTIRPESDGTLFVSADVNGVDSPEVPITVNAAPVAAEQTTTLRGVTYPRPGPRKV